MNKSFNKLTNENVLRNTYWSNRVYIDLMKKIEKYEVDESKETRIKEDRECKSCFYLHGDRIALQAFTDYDCRNCGTTHRYHNSNTPHFCIKCSDEHGVCVRCGGKL